MAALQFVDVPGYNAILFRRTYKDLSLPGALMDRAKEWLGGKPNVHWNEQDHTFTFPSGAKLTFGYLDTEVDKYRYQGAEFSFIGFDELTQFTESQYRYLLSRLRRLKTSNIPLRVRNATNPGGIGHDWVKQRFLIEGAAHDRRFVPARLDDNPSLDADAYRISLAQLDSVTRAQLLNGDWEARASGGKFKREWFKFIDANEAPQGTPRVRRWDLASTLPTKGKDPDWTAGLLATVKNGCFYVLDIVHIRGTPQQVEAAIKATAERDGKTVLIKMEQEGGSSGKIATDYYARNVLFGYRFLAERSTGDKETRANPVSATCENGNVYVVRAAWTTEYIDELTAFPFGSHDDLVDVTSGAFSDLSTSPRKPYSSMVF